MIDVRPQLLEKVASAWSSWYGSGKFKNDQRKNSVRKVHEASTILYLMEQQLEEGSVDRVRLQHIRNKLEELMGDYAGYENRWYPYKSLLKNPGTRTDEVVGMIEEGAFLS